MNLGDVSAKTVPKMTMVSAPKAGGVIATRTFIPHRCYASIGVLGAVSVATTCALPGTPATCFAQLLEGRSKRMPIEHPIGASTILVELGDGGEVESAAVLLTTRKLFAVVRRV
jgi:4-oxalomesaconate tautomerase